MPWWARFMVSGTSVTSYVVHYAMILITVFSIKILLVRIRKPSAGKRDNSKTVRPWWDDKK